MKLGYVRYSVRAFVSKPLQCKHFWGFGHVLSVCRQTEYTEERCVIKGWPCYNCGGDHDSEFVECPVRVKEVEVAKVKVVHQISNVEAIKRIERASEVEEIVVDGAQPIVIGLFVNQDNQTCCT